MKPGNEEPRGHNFSTTAHTQEASPKTNQQKIKRKKKKTQARPPAMCLFPIIFEKSFLFLFFIYLSI
jgi:hypothetical protein